MNTTLTPGEQAFAGAVVNVRRTPGYTGKPADDVLGQIPFRAPLTVAAGPAPADRLTWWQVLCTLPDGRTLAGWAAQTAPNGTTLLLPAPPVLPRPRPRRRGPALFVLNEEATTVLPADLRAAPGMAGEVIAALPAGATGVIAGGPARADGLTWWKLDATLSGQPAQGWVSTAAADGSRILVPAAAVDALDLRRPFDKSFPMRQAWGTNPDFYKQFKYDGVLLRGHNGLDFGIPVGAAMLAVDDGEVIRADFDPGGFGNFVLMDHGWGESLYAHLDRVDVRVKQLVLEGEQVGLSGNTGISTGPHLHFSIRIHPYERRDGWGGFCDPTPFMALALEELPFFAEMAPSPLAEELPGYSRP
jgi:murein DD-endopeptidase MepM/ murein hydrolase activator NlpD